MPNVAPYWFGMLSDCLAAAEREQAGSHCPVVDHEIVTPLVGGPEDVTVWCVCRTPSEKRRFVDTERTRFVSALKRQLLTAGFPENALASLDVRVTSRGEVLAPGFR
ncbi:MAG TPA: hypothetical protein VHD32_12010 [Candidatus Didemnitutus sp.]|nr:hypothetical protein [Candidatus Didemnitutus sp.]